MVSARVSGYGTPSAGVRYREYSGVDIQGPGRWNGGVESRVVKIT